MLKLVGVAAILLLLVGCGTNEMPKFIEDNTSPSIACLNGVTYYVTTDRNGYRGYGFMAVKYNQDGSVVVCSSSE